jgi:rubrerythrin
MERTTSLGLNKTGTQMSPVDARQMAEVADRLSPDSQGDPATALDGVRGTYAAEAQSIGSIPVPGSVKGMAKAGMDKLTGKRPELLMDKLGERAAFERGGARLYDALIAKLRGGAGSGADAADEVGMDEAQLQQIRDEEVEHFRLVCDAIEQLGGDPTAQTPCADSVGVSAMGLVQVVTDPRTTLAQSLNAMLTAELTDNAGWELLIDLARESGHDDIASRFEKALTQEQAHLRQVRGWLEALVLDRKLG